MRNRIAPWMSRSVLVAGLSALMLALTMSVDSPHASDTASGVVVVNASWIEHLVQPDADAIASNAGLKAHFAPGHLAWTHEDDPAWVDVRVDRMPALFVRADEGSPSPFLEPGPFTAVWTGQLVMPSRTRVGFGADTSGAVRIDVNGETVFDTTSDDEALTSGMLVKLNKGANPIVVQFHGDATPGNDTFVRATWYAPKRWTSEPIPPMQLRHASTTALDRSQAARVAREAIARHRCVQCHQADEIDPAHAMPELSLLGPPLSRGGIRLRPKALAAWINDPASIRPHARMPRLFPERPDGSIDPRAYDIAAYLSAPDDGAESSPLSAWRQQVTPDRVTEGAGLFASLGCVGCHVLDDDERDADRISLEHVDARFRDGALAAFLLNPHAHDPAIRMPDFALEDNEATALASFLRYHNASSETATGTATPAAPATASIGDPDRGRALVETMGCLSCHEVDGDRAGNRYAAPPMAFVRLTGWDHGCLAAPSETAGRGAAPSLNLTDAERDALRGADQNVVFASLERTIASEYAARQIEDNQCIACHRRDDIYDRWTLLEGEVDAIHAKFGVDLSGPADAHDEDEDDGYEGDDDAGIEPMVMQNRPPLTWSGGMLLPKFVEARLAGTWREKPRPWLTARMPAFAFDAERFARGLAAQHGYAPDDEPRPAPDLEAASIGEKLIANGTGFGCTQCHAVGDRPAEAVFEVEGINFDLVTQRLRREYFDRWVLQPTRVDPASRMPQYADEYGQTPLIQHYDGDASRQYDAIWQFLRTLE